MIHQTYNKDKRKRKKRIDWEQNLDGKRKRALQKKNSISSFC